MPHSHAGEIPHIFQAEHSGEERNGHEAEGKGTRIEGSEAAFEMEQARGEKAQPQEQKLDQKGAGGQPKMLGAQIQPNKGGEDGTDNLRPALSHPERSLPKNNGVFGAKSQK